MVFVALWQGEAVADAAVKAAREEAVAAATAAVGEARLDGKQAAALAQEAARLEIERLDLELSRLHSAHTSAASASMKYTAWSPIPSHHISSE